MSNEQYAPKKEIPTAYERREALRQKGVSGPLADALVWRTARERHFWRAGAALEAAYGSDIPGDRLDQKVQWVLDGDRASEMFFKILAEVIGRGGRGALGSLPAHSIKSTERASWAKVLGKGRAQAMDGEAWDAAMRQTVYALLGCYPENPYPDERPIDALLRAVGREFKKGYDIGSDGPYNIKSIEEAIPNIEDRLPLLTALAEILPQEYLPDLNDLAQSPGIRDSQKIE